MNTLKNYVKKQRLDKEAFKKKYGHLFDYNDETNGYCIKCIMRQPKSTEVCISEKVGYINGRKCVQVDYETHFKEDMDRIRKERAEEQRKIDEKTKQYENFECGNTNEIINHIAQHDKIYLWGDVGRGKSHFLKYIKRQRGGMYIMAAEMHHELKEEIKRSKVNFVAEKSLINKMKETDRLLLDDLGNEKMTEFVQEALQIVINHRYEHNLPLYVTSNYNLKQLYNRWKKDVGDYKSRQLVDRLRTLGAIEIQGKNYRATALPDI
jgi:DNA replication protein DnaC